MTSVDSHGKMFCIDCKPRSNCKCIETLRNNVLAISKNANFVDSLSMCDAGMIAQNSHLKYLWLELTTDEISKIRDLAKARMMTLQDQEDEKLIDHD